MRKRNLKDILTSPLLMTVYAIILLFVFLLFRFKTDEGIVVNSLEEKNNSSWSCEYNFFRGEKEANMSGKGDNLFISVISEFGEVNIIVEDRNGKKLFNQTVSDHLIDNESMDIFNVKVSPEVKVSIKAKNHKGDFKISYRDLKDFSKESKEGIFLYGETHDYNGIKKIEADLWGKYYKEYGMRNLFIEYSYVDAQFLNIWMKSDDDKILNELFKDYEKTLAYSEENINFFKEIKEKYPETVFYGTDLCHTYKTGGKRYLKYLEENGKAGTDDYNKAVEDINQGKKYYEDDENTETYRENIMVKKFVEEYEKLEDKRIVGIYGTAHVLPYSDDYYCEGPCMAKQLDKKYGNILNIEDLCTLEKYPGYKDSEYRYYK